MDDSVVKNICFPIFQSRNWMKFLGVISIASGILSAISIVGIVFCWLPIWLGVLLFGAANKIEAAYYSGNDQQAVEAFSKIQSFFVISGVVSLISIALSVIGVIFFGAALMAGITEFL